MRFIKKFYKKLQRKKQNKKNQLLLNNLVKNYYKDFDINWKGGSGQDYIYEIIENHYPVAVLRLSLDNSTTKYNNLPFTKLQLKESLEREYNIYKKLYKYNLSPKPIFLDLNNGILCNSYIRSKNFFDILLEDKNKFWDICMQISLKINELHKFNISHMDMSFNNVLFNNNEINFIDFEYSPNQITFEEQKVYDYLRLIESVYKFIPEEIFNNEAKIDNYFKNLNILLDEESKKIKFNNIDKALNRVLNNNLFLKYIKKLFKNSI